MAAVLSFKNAKRFKELGVSQTADKFYENRSKELYALVDIHQPKNFLALFTAAHSSDELNWMLPPDTVTRKTPKGYISSYLDSSSGVQPDEVTAKFELICKLVRKGVVKL